MDTYTCNVSCSELYLLQNELDLLRHQEWMQSIGNGPMPYVGIYIAVASLVCCVAMVADMIQGIRHQKFWMPSRYFTINSASLTVLAITLKLAMDISTFSGESVDMLAKYSGIGFLCTAIANFIPSLGVMNGKDLFQNLVALGILILTLSGNMIIWATTTFPHDNLDAISGMVFAFLVFFQFVILAFSAIAISTIKKEIETKYRRLEKLMTGGDEENGRLLTTEKLRKRTNIYWVMAETGSPEFVMSRAVTSSAAAFICVVSAIFFGFLVLVYSNGASEFTLFGYDSEEESSDYKWATWYILVIQSIDIITCSIAPAIRSLFSVVSLSSKSNLCDYRNTFKVEEYWTSRLKEWKHRPLTLGIRGQTCRKIIQVLRNCFINFCIIMQVIIVVQSKVLRFISLLLLKVVLDCFCYIWRLKRTILIMLKISSDSVGSERECDTELEELKKYVLLLDGEVELPRKILKDICRSVKRVIQEGANEQPEKLKFLSGQNFCFSGLTEFDREQVQSLHLEEPPRCWSLSLSNLACIAIAIPMVTTNEEKLSLLQMVREGLSLARLIEKGLDTKGILRNVGNAADILWNGFDLHRKWMDEYLMSNTVKGKRSSKEVLEYFEEISKKMCVTCKGYTDNASEWPVQLIVANSMYRISKSLQLLEETKNGNDEMVFKRITSMIAEMLVVCLSNLPSLIISKCHSCSVEKRQRSVEEAARLLGATENIIKFIQGLQLPILAPEDAPYMDEWRVLRV